MPLTHRQDAPVQAPHRSRPGLGKRAWALVTIAVTLSLGHMPQAHALDGCLVLLCLAAPNWRAIPQCVPPIRQLLRDLAKGRGFPTCKMAGTGNSARNGNSQAPGNCPPQYTVTVQTDYGPQSSCSFSQVIDVTVNNQPFVRVWWEPSGQSVTEYLPPAKSQLGQWNTQFDQDFNAWQTTQQANDPFGTALP